MSETNTNSRLEAFCDGVFAIAITLLIIDIKVPPINSVHTRRELWMAFAHELPGLFAFLLSFTYILITWVNHSRAFKLISRSSNKFIYANGLLLLSVVLVPFTTAAVAEYLSTAENSLAQPAIVLYCGVILLNNIAWNLIFYACIFSESLLKPNVNIKKAKKQAIFPRYGFVLYGFILILSFWFPLTAFTIMSLSFVMWVVTGIALKEENFTL